MLKALSIFFALVIAYAPFLTADLSMARADDPANLEFQSYLAHVYAAQSSIRLNEADQTRRWLDAAPVAHRNWEWRHLNAMSDESLDIIQADGTDITCVAVSPDGRLAAYSTWGGQIVLADVASQSVVRRLEGHTGPVYTVAFSPDGSRLVSTSPLPEKTARVWDVVTGQTILTFTGHNQTVAAGVFSPDGQRIASCSWEWRDDRTRIEGTVYLWKSDTGEIIRSFAGGRKPLSCITFTADGKSLVCGSWDSVVFMWDVDGTGSPRSFGEPPSPDGSIHVNAVGVSPDGKWLAAGQDNGLARVWNVATGESVATLAAHEADVNAVVFSHDGQTLATGGHDDAIRLWDVDRWNQRSCLRGHQSAVKSLAWAPDGSRLVSGAFDHTLRIWDATHRHYETRILRHGAASYAAVFSPDGQRLGTCGADGTVAIWDSNTGVQIAHWKAHPDSSANSVAFSSDGKRLASCSWDKTARIFDAATQEELRVLKHDSGVAFLSYSPDNIHVATALNDSTARIWNADTGEAVATLTGHEGAVKSVSFSYDGRWLASSSQDKTVRTWHVPSGEPGVVMRGHLGRVETAVFTPDGKSLVSGSEDGSIRLWNASTGELSRVLYVGDEPVHRVAVHPDGTRVAAATSVCQLVDSGGGGLVETLRTRQDTIWHLSFSPDGTRLATCSWDGSIAIHDTVPLRMRRLMTELSN